MEVVGERQKEEEKRECVGKGESRGDTVGKREGGGRGGERERERERERDSVSQGTLHSLCTMYLIVFLLCVEPRHFRTHAKQKQCSQAAAKIEGKLK